MLTASGSIAIAYHAPLQADDQLDDSEGAMNPAATLSQYLVTAV